MQSFWPKDAKRFEVEGSSVDFVTYMQEGVRVIGFDSSSCVPPEPMVNAMLALGFIKDEKTKVVMINHKNPVKLLAKVKNSFHIETKELGENLFRLTFTYKKGAALDLSDASCKG
jgi:hypothetical protein